MERILLQTSLVNRNLLKTRTYSTW